MIQKFPDADYRSYLQPNGSVDILGHDRNVHPHKIVACLKVRDLIAKLNEIVDVVNDLQAKSEASSPEQAP